MLFPNVSSGQGRDVAAAAHLLLLPHRGLPAA